jgi:hypothetical protein
MMGRTEERLRDATAALGQAVQPQDIPELRLPETSSQPARQRRARPASQRWARPARQRWMGGRWLVPVAAAASMLALVGSLIVVGEIVPGPSRPPVSGTTSPPMPVTSGPPLEPSAGQPAFIVAAVDGQGYVLASATGRVVARIRPPVRHFALVGVAAAPGDRIFYLAGQVPTGPILKIEFFKITLLANGQPGPARQLPGPPVIQPFPITSYGLVTVLLAISPDGQELAYASDNQFRSDYATAVPTITIENVVTGQRRTWSLWPTAATQFNSLSWGAGGQLGFVANVGNARVSSGAVVQHRNSQLNVFMVLNTRASGRSLMSDSRILAHAPIPVSDFEVPVQLGPVGGVLSEDGASAYALIRTGPKDGRLVVISVATGAVTRVLLSGPQAVQSDPLSIDGNSLLAPLQLSNLPRKSLYYLSGHYARFDLSTGHITPLPFPLYYRAAAPFPPVEVGW